MKKQKGSLFKKILMLFGLLTILLILAIGILIAFLIIKKPYGIDVTKIAPAMLRNEASSSSSYDHPLLSSSQEALLESVGIDTKTVPTTISPAQEKCATEILGEKRVAEIKNGSTPSITEILQAKSCF